VPSGDRLSAAFFLVAGGLVAWQARALGLGEGSAPGPGFVPFWSAVVLAVLALALLVSRVRPAPGDESPPSGLGRHRRGLLCLATLFVYVGALRYLGFPVSTFLLMLVLFGFGRRVAWPVRIAVSLVVTLAYYALFSRLLLVQFPQGILGF
jgi:putative tricarboxylic transport membrane protein